MSPERFRQVEQVFDAVADAAPEQRGALLDQLCAGDAGLRAEVESLLGALPLAPARLQEVIGRAAGEVLGAAALPRRIGPYRLVSELGRGGMGAVHLAVRDDDEYRTEVAVKLLHRGLETAEAVARFRDERQILATLDHPCIVRLLDGGSTEDRMPYLVMERVAGLPITAWADARDLDVTARVKLFRKVCEAVAYAHQRLVVHRDIKPSNILVNASGEPKLLDFGIAKLLHPAADRAATTRTGMRLLTPEYASPEQVRGQPLTTAADVYSLGAVLYELLAAAPAHRLEGDGIEALNALLQRDPLRPSLVAPPARRRAITGDLDNIVMKALRKEPAGRYASVDQLSEDLLRHLQGLPVLARTGAWPYRVGKLLQRNRGAIAAVAIVLFSMIAGTVVSLRQARRADEQARRAQKRFDQVRRLANAMLFEVDGKIENLAGATQAREVIVRRALSYLDGLASEDDDDAALARELAVAYIKTGDIQGTTLGPSLGRPRDALASYEKAQRIIERLIARGQGDTATRWVLARSLYGIGAASKLTNDLARLRSSAQAAVDVAAALPEDGSFDYAIVARAYAQLFNLETEDANVALARRHVDALQALATRWAAVAGSAESRYWLGISHEARGGILALAADPDGAVPELRAAAAAFAALSAHNPENATYHREEWYARSMITTMLAGKGDAKIWVPALGDLETADREERAALALAQSAALHDPGDTRAVLEMEESFDHLAVIIAERDPAAALALFARARATAASLPVTFRASSYALQFERFGECAMALALARLGRRSEALRALDRGMAAANRNARVAGASFEDRMGPWMCRYQAAQAQRALGDMKEARRLLGDILAGLQPVLAPRPSDILPYVGFVDTAWLLAELQPARRCEHLARAAALWRSWPGAMTPYLLRRQEQLTAALSTCRPGR